jgi:glycosyltransferase involved in cell wall biosynthesis
MTRVTVVLKTNQGGMWVLPQIEELSARGAEVTVVIPGGEGRLRRALDARGSRVIESPFDFSFRPNLKLARGLWALRRVIRESRPDVVFYHLYASALASRLASLGLGVRRVHMVAGPLYLENASIRRVEQVLCRLDSHLIAGSAYTARAYRGLGMPTSRLSAIPYGVDTERFARGQDRRGELLNIDAETFVVVMVAYVYAPKSAVFPGVGIKGHDVLLAAWAEFAATHPDSLLVLVGSGFDDEGEAHRRRLVEQYAIDGDATIRWFESVDDVRPLYSSADLSVSPSLSENHGAALEASSMGLPSIVSDAGGLPETVTPETGWVVRAGDDAGLVAALEAARHEFDLGVLTHRGRAARSLMQAEFDVSGSVRGVAAVVLGEAAR